ncbi:kinase-like protein [Hymenopellis radicata]|nr:kinase-like protein [Hymenopellis radicata]
MIIEEALDLLHSHSAPWEIFALVEYDVAAILMDSLQTEWDTVPSEDAQYRSKCLKCLRTLSKRYDIIPSLFFSPTSFSGQDIRREGAFPVAGGGFGDIWRGTMAQKAVCLKVLRLFTGSVTEQARKKLFKQCWREALVWSHLEHPNVLPFLGVNSELFHPSICLISPWLENGNIIAFLENHPTHDRFRSLLEILEGIRYLHEHRIVHADIRGANILVTEDFHCCLADFGLSLVAESQMIGSSAMELRGSLRWLAPEIMDGTSDILPITARDIYAFGCTVIEIFTGHPPFSHIKTEVAVIHQVLTLKESPPRPPIKHFPSDELWSLVLACLSSAPKSRPGADSALQQLRSLHYSGLSSSHSNGRIHALDPGAPMQNPSSSRARYTPIPPRDNSNHVITLNGTSPSGGRRMFGVDLTELMHLDDAIVPLILEKCCEAIERNGIDTYGLYKVDGTMSKVTALKQQLDTDLDSVELSDSNEWTSDDIYSVADVIKMWLRELPNPIITPRLQAGFMNAAEIDNDRLRHIRLHEQVNELPDASYAALRYLLGHLHNMIQCESTNRMGAKSISLVFGPVLFGRFPTSLFRDQDEITKIQNTAIHTILVHYTDIFVDD